MRFPALTVTLIVASGLLAACGVNSSGVRNLSPDTYTISADDLDASTAKGEALGLADSYCKKNQKQVLVTNIFQRHQIRYYYDIAFLCLKPGDPRLTNPQYETVFKSK